MLRANERVHAFFSWLMATATRLTQSEYWQLIVTNSMEVFRGNDPPNPVKPILPGFVIFYADSQHLPGTAPYFGGILLSDRTYGQYTWF
jgi:hypothetical protein